MCKLLKRLGYWLLFILLFRTYFKLPGTEYLQIKFGKVQKEKIVIQSIIMSKLNQLKKH